MQLAFEGLALSGIVPRPARAAMPDVTERAHGCAVFTVDQLVSGVKKGAVILPIFSMDTIPICRLVPTLEDVIVMRSLWLLIF